MDVVAPLIETDSPSRADLRSDGKESSLIRNASHSSIYLLRTVQQGHMHLSAQADQKANMLIGISSIIFSVLLGYSQKYGFTPELGILFVSTFTSAALAIFAAMPGAKGPGPGSKGFNPLFFGSFCQLNPEEYCREMEKTLSNHASVYTAMAMDIYGLGMVLYRKKYRYLSFGYRIFLGGLFVAGVCAVARLAI